MISYINILHSVTLNTLLLVPSTLTAKGCDSFACVTATVSQS